jgi:CBS-domain-containing membrane protein
LFGGGYGLARSKGFLIDRAGSAGETIHDAAGWSSILAGRLERGHVNRKFFGGKEQPLDTTWLEQSVWSLPLKPVVAVLPAASVRQAMANMRQMRVGCVFRLDEHGRAVGQLSQAHLWSLLAERGVGLEASVEPYLAPVERTVRWDRPARELLTALGEARSGQVCVVNQGGEAIALADPAGLLHGLAESIPGDGQGQAQPTVPEAMQQEVATDRLASA